MFAASSDSASGYFRLFRGWRGRCSIRHGNVTGAVRKAVEQSTEAGQGEVGVWRPIVAGKKKKWEAGWVNDGGVVGDDF